MKYCPHCGAQLEDHASFCLYCMTSLDEKVDAFPKKKPKKWLFLLLGILMTFALNIYLLHIPYPLNPPKDITLNTPSTQSTVGTVPSESTVSTNITPTESTADSSTESTDPMDPTESIEPTDPTEPIEPTEPTEPIEPTEPMHSTNPTSPTNPTEPTQSTPTTPPTTQPTTPPTTQPTAPKAPDTTPVLSSDGIYLYRDAIPADDANGNTPEANSITILAGLLVQKTLSIPETIDGKKVAYIGTNAMNASEIEVLYIPKTLKGIHYNAFLNCPITDVYVSAENISIHEGTFPDADNLVFHSSSTCKQIGSTNRLLKDYAASLGMTWQEWTGTAPYVEGPYPQSNAYVYGPVVYLCRWTYSTEDPLDTNTEFVQKKDNYTIYRVRGYQSVWHIPEEIDGKPIRCLANEAMEGSQAKIVYTPKYLNQIWHSAFDDCVLTDLYIAAEQIQISRFKSSPDLIVHCSSTCQHISTKRLLKDILYMLEATWEEWNG